MSARGQEQRAYRKLVGVLRKRHGRATAADLTAETALPLETVRELANAAADEFSGRLEVTQSGEILYSFPKGFTSRYRGFAVTARRAGRKCALALMSAGTWLFKVWIMVMLIGYFTLFVALAFVSLFISVSASRSNRSSGRDRRGVQLDFSIVTLLMRMWFYSELAGGPSRYGRGYRGGAYQGNRSSVGKKPVYQAVFSFVFGDGDPNAGWTETEKKAVIAYIQAHRGVITLGEFMILTGKNPSDAQRDISAYCVEFSGSPEVSAEGTLVFRFDKLLPRSSGGQASALSPPPKTLRIFSSNPKKTNGLFAVINGINLVFGSYFLFKSLTVGILYSQAQAAAQGLYGMTFALFEHVAANPLPLIGAGLGLAPIAFSFFFWIIPLLRSLYNRKENKKIQFENQRKEAYRLIWEHPDAVREHDIKTGSGENEKSRDRIIKELGAYSGVDVSINERGETCYTFTELRREKEAAGQYRADIKNAELGDTVFDSGF
ncbi:MAG: hypothetical protein LBI85_00860 [Spirochaetaceae bacterium]|jgi:hypothetical protein|nr:hypothetical protein [Spirochaetaceae bacterium]